MKKFIRKSAIATIATISVCLTGCLKDKVETTQRYAIYTPEYKTVGEIRTNLLTLAPREIQYPGKIYVKGNYLFLGETNRGIHIIDNRTPAAPKNVGYIEIPYNADMAVKNNALYADMGGDLLSIDISDPSKAKVKNIMENVFPEQRWRTANDKVVVNWSRRDTMVHTRAAAKPVDEERWYPINLEGTFINAASYSSIPGAIYGTGGSLARFAATKERLFTVGFNNLAVFNIRNDFAPAFVKRKDIGFGIETIFPFGEHLFVGSVAGVKVFSLQNPGDPDEIGSFGHVRSCDPVVTDGKHIFVTLRAGTNCGGGVNELQILSANSLTDLSLVKSYPLENPFGLAIDNGLLMICDGQAGLKVYDAKNVNDLRLKQEIRGITPYDIIASGGLAIVSAKEGIFQFDYKAGGTLRQVSTLVLKNKTY